MSCDKIQRAYRVAGNWKEGMEQMVTDLESAAWVCMRYAWCLFYSRIAALKPEYISHRSMFAVVEYFWIDLNYRSITAHYKRQSPFYKLCVSEKPSSRVTSRNGKHHSDGHKSMFCFNQNGDCFVQCFDEECNRRQSHYLGRWICRLPTEVCENVHRAFKELDRSM
jgi:hypothetical protein